MFITFTGIIFSCFSIVCCLPQFVSPSATNAAMLTIEILLFMIFIYYLFKIILQNDAENYCNGVLETKFGLLLNCHTND
jgi:uncharacterized membrane protein YozB (DUF420 family)